MGLMDFIRSLFGGDDAAPNGSRPSAGADKHDGPDDRSDLQTELTEDLHQDRFNLCRFIIATEGAVWYGLAKASMKYKHLEGTFGLDFDELIGQLLDNMKGMSANDQKAVMYFAEQFAEFHYPEQTADFNLRQHVVQRLFDTAVVEIEKGMYHNVDEVVAFFERHLDRELLIAYYAHFMREGLSNAEKNVHRLDFYRGDAEFARRFAEMTNAAEEAEAALAKLRG
jgi:hypothetical protein